MHAVHKNTHKKRKYLFVIVVLGIVLITDPFNILSVLRGTVATLFLPINHITQHIGVSVGRSFDIVVHMGDMYAQNQKLAQENQQLRAQIMQLTDVQKENVALRKEYDLSPRDDFTLIAAEVVVRDALGGDHWVMINRGTKDGVAEDMAVIVGEGIFVGYTDAVDYATARVRLLTHPKSVVNVVNANSGAEALSRGQHGLSIVVEDIKKGDAVHDGDVFVTSQIGNKFARGFSVGTAQNVALSEDDLFQSANIIPLASLSDIRFVSVVKK